MRSGCLLGCLLVIYYYSARVEKAAKGNINLLPALESRISVWISLLAIIRTELESALKCFDVKLIFGLKAGLEQRKQVERVSGQSSGATNKRLKFE